MANVSPNIEQLMRSNRLEEPFAETATEPRAHPPQVERDDADKGASIAEIKREWNLALEQGWIGLVVDEDGSLPCGEQQRFTDVPQVYKRVKDIAAGLAFEEIPSREEFSELWRKSHRRWSAIRSVATKMFCKR